MRVHELSKLINVKNNELVNYLSSVNSKITSHSCSITEEEAEMAKKHFMGAGNTDTVKQEKPAEKKEKPVSAEKPAENTVKSEQRPENRGDKPEQAKKRIFSSFNPQNSGRREVRDQRRPDKNNRNNRDGRPENRNDGRRPDGTRPGDRIRLDGTRLGERNVRPDGTRPSDRVRPDGSRVENRPQRNDGANRNFRNDGDNRSFRNDGDNRGFRNDGERQNRGPRPEGGFNRGPRPDGERQNRGPRPEGGFNRGPRPDGDRNQRFDKNDRNRGGSFGGDDRRNASPNDRNRGPRRDDRSSGAAFDSGDAMKETAAKEQRSRDRENRKKDINSHDRQDRLENTKALEKNINKIKQQQKKKEEEETIRTIIIPDIISISDLADKIKTTPAALVKKLFLAGTVVTINQEISFEQAEEIALEYNCICEHEVKIDVIEELLKEDEDDPSTLVPRPPVVCVMGHVDHGKTSLLDAIRSTHVTEREAGGITQHIGAYTVKTHGQQITFLDTPGHEAFTAMRMRGAKSTDIAILVVAADDGVMPQTIEAINHAKAAGIEIVVAINKIDKPSANIERVKQELVEHELIPEDWGGSTIFCPVSAHTGEGIDNLLDMLLLTAEILELKANPNRRARGLVIEGRLDKGKGPVATLLVQKGTLHIGDCIAVGPCHGRIRAMADDKGKKIQKAGPSIPVEIIGLDDVPNAGDVFVSPESEKEARAFAETYIREGREKLIEETKSRMSLDDLFNQIKEGNLKELNIIVKADVQGSVEAVKQSLLKLSNEEVVVKVIHAGVGAINESDVTLASASNAIIIGFNVRPDSQAKGIADNENVDIRLYRVIYQAIEDVEAAMKGMLDPKFEEKVIGHAEVRQTYKASNIGTIAGVYVLDGMLTRSCSIRLMRGDDMVYDGPLASLKRFKDDAKEVKEGYECGCVLEKFNDVREGDIIEAYTMVEIPR